MQDKLNVLYETDLYENQRQKYDRILIIHIYIYIYTKFIVWCEGEERSIPLQVERKQSKHTRQRSAVATLSFTPVGDLQATGSSNLLQAHINKGDI